MIKALQELFTRRAVEQTYLAELLQSAKWLGWEMPETPAAKIELFGVTKPVASAQPAETSPAKPLTVNKLASGVAD